MAGEQLARAAVAKAVAAGAVAAAKVRAGAASEVVVAVAEVAAKEYEVAGKRGKGMIAQRPSCQPSVHCCRSPAQH